jgi:hypothetical protein
MRKEKIIFCGIAFAFALILESCPASAPDEFKSLGESLSLSGQMYVRDIDASHSIAYNEYKSDLEVSDSGIGGAGEIKKGKLQYSSIEKPKLSPVADSLAMLEEVYKGITFSPEDTQAALLNLTIPGSAEYSFLFRETIKVNLPSFTYETVYYVYVDRDAVVTAEAGSFTPTDFFVPMSLTSQKINLKLKKGWNALHSTITAGFGLFLLTGDLKMSIGNPPSFKWTLGSLQDVPF